MKRLLTFFAVFFITGFLFAQSDILSAETYASFYGEAFHGRKTASGEIYDMNAYTAAHKTLPFGTVVEVTNLNNGRKIFVRINDRGPFVANREIDLSKAAASALGMLQQGVARVSLRLISLGKDTQSTPQPTIPQPNMHAKTPPAYVQYTTTAPVLIYQPTNSRETSGILWRIQLGSFTREENAYRLVKKLRKIGFEPAYEKSENLIRVVLHGIKPMDLNRIKSVLKENRITDYIIRQEAW
ncbi:MAG: septal ring lytic transglycosylase RlpA family lipoprotein [Treponema sp.]|nr:MAG: septal ring lytic transglycosylase RlpA family lipoprotein [Treponema sp.]